VKVKALRGFSEGIPQSHQYVRIPQNDGLVPSSGFPLIRVEAPDARIGIGTKEGDNNTSSISEENFCYLLSSSLEERSDISPENLG
jgi:hypothetical protein